MKKLVILAACALFSSLALAAEPPKADAPAPTPAVQPAAPAPAAPAVSTDVTVKEPKEPAKDAPVAAPAPVPAVPAASPAPTPSPAIKDALVSPTTAPATITDETSPGQVAKALSEAVKTKNWKVTILLALVILIWGIRAVGGRFIPWFKTDRGGALTALLSGTILVFANAAVAGLPFDIGLVVDGVFAGFTAAGGYVTTKKLFFPSDLDTKEKLPGVNQLLTEEKKPEEKPAEPKPEGGTDVKPA